MNVHTLQIELKGCDVSRANTLIEPVNRALIQAAERH